MDRLTQSSDHWPLITAASEGVSAEIGLELTYHFSPPFRRMLILLRALPAGADYKDEMAWKCLDFYSRDPQIASLVAGTHDTARRVIEALGLPHCCAHQMREHLEAMTKKLEPFVQNCFQGRCCEKEISEDIRPSSATLVSTPERDEILVFVDRDVSRFFGRRSGVYLLHYSLISEPHAFRCILSAWVDGKAKVTEFRRTSVQAIYDQLGSREVAIKVARHFGNDSDAAVGPIADIMKIAFVSCTDQARTAKALSVAPPTAPSVPTPDVETIPLTAIKQPFMVFSGGDYFEVR